MSFNSLFSLEYMVLYFRNLFEYWLKFNSYSLEEYSLININLIVVRFRVKKLQFRDVSCEIIAFFISLFEENNKELKKHGVLVMNQQL